MRGTRKFVRRIQLFPLLLGLRGMGGSKYHYKKAIIIFKMVFQWHADDGPTLNAGLVAM